MLQIETQENLESTLWEQVSWKTSILTSWSWRGQEGLLLPYSWTGPASLIQAEDAIKASSNTFQSALRHLSTDTLLAALNGITEPCARSSTSPCPSSSPPVCSLDRQSGVNLQLQWMPRGQKGVECNPVGHHHVVYWAAVSLMPGRGRWRVWEERKLREAANHVLKPQNNLFKPPLFIFRKSWILS